MRRIYSIAGITLVIVGLLLASRPSSAQGVCTDIVTIFLRGSGQPAYIYGTKDYIDSDSLNETKDFLGQVRQKTNNYTYEGINLTNFVGYSSKGYVAVPVGPWGQPLVNMASAEWTLAKLTGGNYPQSVEDGVQELTGFLQDRVIECPDQKIVLGGYSQGAQVVGETLWRLPKNVGNKLTFVALFGDPKFNPGPIYQSNPNSRFLSLAQMKTVTDPSFKSHELGQAQAAQAPWLRGDFEYAKYGGSLDARNPYIPDYLYGRVGSWCTAGDYVCSSIISTSNLHAHQHYPDVWIPQATDEIAERLKSALEARELLKIQTQLTMKQEHQKPTDIMLVREITPNMARVNSSIQGWAKNYAKAIIREYPNARVGVTQYCDIGKNVSNAFIAKQTLAFTNNFDDIVKGIQYLEPGCKSSDGTAAALLSGLDVALNSPDWDPTSNKKILVINMSPARDWDPYILKSTEPLTGLSVDGEISKAVTKGVSISIIQQPIYNQSIAHMQLVRFVNGTNGRYSETAGEVIVQQLRNTLELQFTNPDAVIQGPFTGSVSSPYVKEFNSATSSSSSTPIKEYRWDFNDDGVIDRVTGTTGSLSSGPWDYTDRGYIGLARLHVIGDNGENDSDVTPVYIPGKPKSPPALSTPIVTVSDRTLSGSALHLAWQPQPNVLSYRIAFADTQDIITIVDEATTGVDLIDIPRADSANIIVTALASDVSSSSTPITVLPGPALQKPLAPIVDNIYWQDLHNLVLSWHQPDDLGQADEFTVSYISQVIYRGVVRETVLHRNDIDIGGFLKLTAVNEAGESQTVDAQVPLLPTPEPPSGFDAIWQDRDVIVFSWLPPVVQTFVEGYRLLGVQGEVLGVAERQDSSFAYRVIFEGIGGIFNLVGFNTSGMSHLVELAVSDNLPAVVEAPETLILEPDMPVEQTTLQAPTNLVAIWYGDTVVRLAWDEPTDTTGIDGYTIIGPNSSIVTNVPVGTHGYDITGVVGGVGGVYGIYAYNAKEQSDILSVLLADQLIHIATESNPPDKGSPLDQNTTSLPPAPPQPSTDITIGTSGSSNPGSTFNQQQATSPQTLGSSSTESGSVSPQNTAIINPQDYSATIQGEGLQKLQVHDGGISYWWVMGIAAVIVIILAIYQRFARSKPKD